jgi:hypothetical protein
LGGLVFLCYFKYRHRSFLNLAEDTSWILAKVLDDDPVNLNESIPLVIHQTYISANRVPEKVVKNITEFAPTHKREFYDDQRCKEFLLEHFDGKVLDAYNSLRHGAHKADLFRYCVLYIKGGIYLDIKTQLIKPIKELFPDNKITTVISKKPNEIYQGIIAAPARQPIFLSLIAAILKSGPNPPYNLFIKDFMKYIKTDISAPLPEGSSSGKTQNYYIYREKCSREAKDCEDGLDRYGWCCNVYANETRVIKTRYADYPL